jgi:hypothetical protein
LNGVEPVRGVGEHELAVLDGLVDLPLAPGRTAQVTSPDRDEDVADLDPVGDRTLEEVQRQVVVVLEPVVVDGLVTEQKALS